MIQPIHSILFIIIAFFLSFAVYAEFILQYRKGKTLLNVDLKRANRLDGGIFIGLICIAFYQQGAFSGPPLTIYLLGFLLLLSIYIYFIRTPKFILKEKGFFFANFFIPYKRVRAMRLTDEGILVLELEVKELLVQVSDLDDLEKIYYVLTGRTYDQDPEQNESKIERSEE